ncbi:hypothetical protein [Rhodospirillum centenum]|uniref:EF hand domain protein n=1 Tax=Rhodospirillum centenum (strain ATCC 51521 / SW) TaxID=414684 RepID=B6IX31_RHOCS|nr:hypothetical protein [Rhodospirillum centenum]ACJ00855.1 EF hand domain protein [Rhodospirillum centenum SW]
MRQLPAFAALTLLLAACAGSDPDIPRPRLTALSPAGELLSAPTPDPEAYRAALTDWFRRADRNGDGAVDRIELLADTDRAFAAFDLNRDGRITAAELTEYRLRSPFRAPPEPTGRDRPGTEGTPGGDPSAAGVVPRERAARSRARPRLDAVMSADTDADFQVTAAELRTQAEARFAAADADGDGRLTLEEVQALATRTLEAAARAVDPRRR